MAEIPLARGSLSNEESNKSGNKCVDCGKVYETAPDLAKHMINIHKHIAHHCNDCQKSFSTPGELRIHFEAQHLNEFRCDYCDKTFINKRNLRQHFLRKHKQDERSFQCRICGHPFHDEDSLSNHMLTFHREPKNKCSKQATGTKLLPETIIIPLNKEFQIKESVQVEEDPLSDAKVKSLKNNEQQKESDITNVKMESMIQRGSNENKDCFATSVMNPTEHPKGSQISDLARSNFDFHLRSSLNGKGSSKAECQICGKLMASKSSLQFHLAMMHRQEKNFECTLCSQKFSSRQNLETHKDRKHNCASCDKVFTLRQEKLKHIRKIHGSNLKVLEAQNANVKENQKTGAQFFSALSGQTVGDKKEPRSIPVKNPIQKRNSIKHDFTDEKRQEEETYNLLNRGKTELNQFKISHHKIPEKPKSKKTDTNISVHTYSDEDYDLRMKTFHDDVGERYDQRFDRECELCGRCFGTEEEVIRHAKGHQFKMEIVMVS